MIYELRTYWAAPGKHEALHQRFRTLTLRIFARHDMRVIGFWTPSAETEASGSLIYMLAFSSEDAMKQGWDAFRADPEWREGKTVSEKDGALVSRLESRVLLPTDYSPLG